MFALPFGGAARLVSRAAAPYEARPWVEDRRRLGVMVQRLAVRQGGAVRVMALDGPGLHDGWWRPEGTGGAMWRWTDGDAAIALPDGPVMLEVMIGSGMSYPVERRAAA